MKYEIWSNVSERADRFWDGYAAGDTSSPWIDIVPESVTDLCLDWLFPN
jgi:hypothetical protein